MGQPYPSHLTASHINMVVSPPPSWKSPFSFVTMLTRYMLGMYSAAEKAGLEAFQKNGMGYYAV